jgi:hypothetical protein
MYSGETRPQISKAVAGRLLSLIGQRLAVPVSPMPGEGLADLFYRAASQNGYKRLINIFHKGGFSHLAFAKSKPDLRAVADLLGTPNGEEDLVDLQYCRWSDEGLWINFFGAAIPSRQLSGWRRVSPSSLRISPHSKAMWHLNAINFDVRTHERLLDRCPVCETRLTFLVTAGVCRCHVCGPAIDFRDYEQPRIECDDLEALDFATGLIDPENPFGKPATLSLHPAIRDENPGQIFSLCMVIAMLLERPPDATGKRSVAWTSFTPNSLAAGARAVLTWPDGLANILSKSSASRSANVASDTKSFLNLCKNNGVLKTSMATAIEEAAMISRLGMKQSTASRRLEIASPEIGPDKVLELAHFTAAIGSRQFSHAVRLTNIPRIVLYNCYLSGVCGPLAASTNDIGPQILQWASLLDFSRARRTKMGSSGTTVRRCVASINLDKGDVWPEVIKAIHDGRLPVKVGNPSGWLLKSLYVEDPDTWIDFLRNAQGVTATKEFPLNGREIAFYMGVSMFTARKLFDFTGKTSFRDIQTYRKHQTPLEYLACLTSMAGKPLSKGRIHRLLEAAGLRSHSDDFVSRAEALRYLGLN